MVSVIVTMICGVEPLRRCLTALYAQRDVRPAQVLVTHDDRFPDANRLSSEFPEATFIRVAGVCGTDRQRVPAVRAAGGDIIAITEDFCVCDPDWCAQIVAAFAEPAVAAVGGGMEMHGDRIGLVDWAFFLYDYGLYVQPVPDAATRQFTDTNVAYRGDVIRALALVWQDGFYIPTINDAIAAAGHLMRLSPRIVVRQRRSVTIGGVCREVCRNGRTYGRTRVRNASGGERIKRMLLTPLAPLVLVQRRFDAMRRATRGAGRLIATTALVMLFAVSWTWGELLGYLSPRARLIQGREA
ncbi:MAG: glycosyltransferase [Phycisphaerae bacterium]|nr:glycosyltransferase [Phycisphaerae bacterium]